MKDLEIIFSDFNLIKIESSYPYPGVVFKAKKPLNFVETITENIPLYSIAAEKRVVNISPEEIVNSNQKHASNNNIMEL